ncbi:TPA: hypothetical protein ACXYLK_001943 [Legionella pneumophila]|nr:hypothetical protein [Legionella pneumophila]ERB41171.1 hypothetical protein N748_10300 [Legionella pneumophila str. 121004]ERH42613.1 hypothetical protein N751_04420 [Legionella pneumophila str. Leg01/11]ERH46771.1 hypothetical protein N750_03900 [Legionella pneumophila str. Leg01/53]ERI46515.1 hypothetical protein N749_04215 [Legionella pneumophila str. Leg01/20]MCW8431301.1 hypothetical protein [Legionella pneumophila]
MNHSKLVVYLWDFKNNQQATKHIQWKTGFSGISLVIILANT